MRKESFQLVEHSIFREKRRMASVKVSLNFPHFLFFHETFQEIRHREMTMIARWLQWKWLVFSVISFQFSIHSYLATSGLVEIEFIRYVHRIVVSNFSCWRFSCLKSWLKKIKKKFQVQCQNFVKRIRPWCSSAKWNMNGEKQIDHKKFYYVICLQKFLPALKVYWKCAVQTETPIRWCLAS